MEVAGNATGTVTGDDPWQIGSRSRGGLGFCSGSSGFQILLGPSGSLAPPDVQPLIGVFSWFHSQLRSLSLSLSSSLS